MGYWPKIWYVVTGLTVSPMTTIYCAAITFGFGLKHFKKLRFCAANLSEDPRNEV